MPRITNRKSASKPKRFMHIADTPEMVKEDLNTARRLARNAAKRDAMWGTPTPKKEKTMDAFTKRFYEKKDGVKPKAKKTSGLVAKAASTAKKSKVADASIGKVAKVKNGNYLSSIKVPAKQPNVAAKKIHKNATAATVVKSRKDANASAPLKIHKKAEKVGRSEVEAKKRGRPVGSKNKSKIAELTHAIKKRGRPHGSKNKPKFIGEGESLYLGKVHPTSIKTKVAHSVNPKTKASTHTIKAHGNKGRHQSAAHKAAIAAGLKKYHATHRKLRDKPGKVATGYHAAHKKAARAKHHNVIDNKGHMKPHHTSKTAANAASKPMSKHLRNKKPKHFAP